MMEEPKISINECLQKEKQIVVDPLSLKGSSIKPGFFAAAWPTVNTTLSATDLYPPPLPPPNQKFMSLSLPNSANSSPRRAGNLTSKHQDWLQETHIRKSKSYGEGRSRATSDEFDLWLSKPSATEYDIKSRDSFSRIEAINGSPDTSKDMQTPADEGFKCSALCLYLPGFGKAKPVKARKEGSEMEDVISRTVSLEKFECGSWASSALFHEIDEGGDPTSSSFFDLPLELIKFSANDDVHTPVKSAFVFEKGLKGVLKNGSTRASGRKSEASPRHVRFSTSSSASHHASPPSCVTPNVRKTRDDFNAFLEAQSA
ncbi:hypothetical protein RIF29_33283 [Crotalaria pallida]|uniref:Uncharacterized protein n=1 Tax=Crotalaria pallida TaxID=3830 RepID=A0AAN9EDI2_CROPI